MLTDPRHLIASLIVPLWLLVLTRSMQLRSGRRGSAAIRDAV